MANPNDTSKTFRQQLPTPLRVQSEDGTIRLLLTSRGVSLQILGHDYTFIVGENVLRKAGAYVRPETGHDTWAKEPGECRGCQSFLVGR